MPDYACQTASKTGTGPYTLADRLSACVYAQSLQSCPTLCEPARLLWPWDSPGKNTGVGCHAMGWSWPRDWTWVSCIAGRFFIAEPPGKPRWQAEQRNNRPTDTSKHTTGCGTSLQRDKIQLHSPECKCQPPKSGSLHKTLVWTHQLGTDSTSRRNYNLEACGKETPNTVN